MAVDFITGIEMNNWPPPFAGEGGSIEVWSVWSFKKAKLALHRLCSSGDTHLQTWKSNRTSASSPTICKTNSEKKIRPFCSCTRWVKFPIECLMN